MNEKGVLLLGDFTREIVFFVIEGNIITITRKLNLDEITIEELIKEIYDKNPVYIKFYGPNEVFKQIEQVIKTKGDIRVEWA